MKAKGISRRMFLRATAGVGAGLMASGAGLTLLTGCGPGQKVPLRVVSTEGDPKAIEVATTICDAYMEENPNVEIAYENIPWGDFMSKAMAAAAAKEDFGVQLSWASLSGELAAEGLLASVGDIIDKVGRDDFRHSALLEYGGENFILPYFMTAGVLFYRTDLFEEKGLNPPVTWDDLRKCCEAFTEDTDGSGGVDRWGITLPFSRTASVQTFILSFIKANGGYLLDEEGAVVWDSPQNIETMEYLKSLLPYAPPGWSEASWGEEISNYYTGATAMSRYGGRLLSRTKEFNEPIYQTTKCVEMPTPNGKPEERISLVEVAGIAIWKDIVDLDVAKDFSHSFVTGENYMDWVHTVVPHYLPPRDSVVSDPAYWEHEILQEKRECVETMLQVLDTGTNFMFEHGYYDADANHIFASNLIPDCIQEMTVGDAEVAPTMQKYAQQMKELIEQA